MEAWKEVALSRHPARPTAADLIELACDYFFEIKGDRTGTDDPAVIAGLATMGGERIAVTGHNKGRSAAERKLCNLGMPGPRGFGKARRLFRLAEKLSLPVLCLVDTPGAFPGLEAEEGGQAWAISANLAVLASLRTPVVIALVGEGGSGGALALGIGDAVLMMEHATFSVISPEGCASILWKDAGSAPEAARALRLTSRDMLELDLVDAIVPEGPGGAHLRPSLAAGNLAEAVLEHLRAIAALPTSSLLARRRERYLRLAFHLEASGETGRGRAPAGSRS